MQTAVEVKHTLEKADFSLLMRADCEELLPSLRFSKDKDHAFVAHYTHPTQPWSLSIASLGEHNKGLYSLGGFRIVPEARAAREGFNPDREALELALGMEKKISWSREIRVAGPLGLAKLDKIVGGKCVLLPSKGARVGEAEDIELLTFATECLNHFQVETGIAVITGQDLGHGKLSNGTATSLEFLHEQFEGSVLADTSKPTAEGNYYTLVGALNALRIPMKKARLGFVGVGNIGRQVLNRCIEGGAHVIGLEYSAKTRAELQESDIEVWEAERKHEFFKLPVDAFVINANAGTLDTETIIEAAENPELKFICGCENLIMPNPGDVKILRQHEKIYIPTEYAGMMGYLTAVEENLCAKANKHFDVKVMFEAAKKLEPITEDAVSYIVRNNHTLFFNEALTAVTEVS